MAKPVKEVSPFVEYISKSSSMEYTKENGLMDKSLAHTKWNCKYHLIWIPKYRRKVIYGKYRKALGQIIRQLCENKGIEIVEANACVDHIHMLVKIPPKYSVSSIVGYLKGKSALMIFERFANLKYKFGNRIFTSQYCFIENKILLSYFGPEFEPPWGHLSVR